MAEHLEPDLHHHNAAEHLRGRAEKRAEKRGEGLGRLALHRGAFKGKPYQRLRVVAHILRAPSLQLKGSCVEDETMEEADVQNPLAALPTFHMKDEDHLVYSLLVYIQSYSVYGSCGVAAIDTLGPVKEWCDPTCGRSHVPNGPPVDDAQRELGT